MKLSELKSTLIANPSLALRFLLPNGELVPAHAHVTEVARMDKRFIDCGGTLRTDSLCRLQTWFAEDGDHRLMAARLLKIFSLADSLSLNDDLEVDVEHEVGFISQFPIQTVEVKGDEMIFHLGVRHTACLAMEKCLSPVAAASEFNPLKFNFKETPPASKCCG
jgi:hypothetical protein